LLRLLDQDGGDADVVLSQNHIRVQLPTVRLTSKLIDGRFPDYNRVIPKPGDRCLRADRATLKDSLSRTAILSNEKYRGVRLVLDPAGLRIQAHNPEQDEAEEELEARFTGEAMEVGFNVGYLLDVLGVMGGDEIEMYLSDSNNSALLYEPGVEHSRYVVMPMRL
jgi:DNA polymerase-3 subunit beta